MAYIQTGDHPDDVNAPWGFFSWGKDKDGKGKGKDDKGKGTDDDEDKPLMSLLDLLPKDSEPSSADKVKGKDGKDKGKGKGIYITKSLAVKKSSINKPSKKMTKKEFAKEHQFDSVDELDANWIAFTSGGRSSSSSSSTDCIKMAVNDCIEMM